MEKKAKEDAEWQITDKAELAAIERRVRGSIIENKRLEKRRRKETQ